MSENSTLHIHTQLRPEEPIVSVRKGRTRRWSRPHRPKERLTRGERLLRNSAIACAALLGVLALGNLDEPWAVKAREGVRQALTMRIDLDDSLGELTFVRDLMPDSALVFLNVSGGGAMLAPVDGEITHAWTALQPWTLFTGEGDVRATGAGAHAQRAIGITTFSGMLAATVVGIIFVPALYCVFQRLRETLKRIRG